MPTIGLELVPPFLAVAELGSFSAAASRLGVDKSSVSRAVSRLEHAFGAQLFLRTTRRVALTETGRSVRDRLREPYDNLDGAVKALLDSARSPRGRVALTAPPDFGAAILTEALVRFARRYPHVEVDVRLSNQFVDLVSNDIDAAIRLSLRPLKDSSLIGRRLCEPLVGIYAARSHIELHGSPQTLAEAALQPWVILRAVRELRLQGPEGAVRLALEGRLSCDDMTFVHRAVLHGAGLGLLPAFLAEPDVREGRLVPILPRYTCQGGALWFLTPAGQKPTRATDALRSFLSELLATRSAFRFR